MMPSASLSSLHGTLREALQLVKVCTSKAAVSCVALRKAVCLTAYSVVCASLLACSLH